MEPTGPTVDPETPGLTTGKQFSWLRRMSPCGPCRRLGIGWRAVRGVFGSGRGGLLWPRLMTGMWGGRGEDEGKVAVEVGGGRGHGEVLAGAGRSGGGEESVGDPLVEAAGAVVLFGPPSFSSSSSSSVSMEMGSGAAVVSAW